MVLLWGYPAEPNVGDDSPVHDHAFVPVQCFPGWDPRPDLASGNVLQHYGPIPMTASAPELKRFAYRLSLPEVPPMVTAPTSGSASNERHSIGDVVIVGDRHVRQPRERPYSA